MAYSADLTVLEPETVTIEEPARTARRTQWWWPLAVFLGVAAVLWLVVWASAAWLPREYLYRSVQPRLPGGLLFEGWARWDASWYRSIVRDGYVYYPGVQSSVAFFPGYPLVIKALSWMFPSIYLTGTAVTVTSGLVVAVLFHRWCRERLSPRATGTALILLLVYPYSWYLFGAVYADALFLAAIIGAFLLLEKDHLWLAGLAGAVATAARPTGIALAIALVLRLAEKRNAPVSVDDDQRLVRRLWARFDPRALRRSDAPIFLAFAGLGTYMLYLWVRFGDPFLFADIESAPGWDQPSGWRTWLKIGWFHDQLTAHNSTFARGIALQAVLCLGFVLLIPRVARRFGWGYGVFVLVVVGIPLLGSKDFQGLGRYLLAAFPVFALAGEALAERAALRRMTIAVSTLLLMVFASLFARGYYLA